MTAQTMEQMLDDLQEKCFVEAYARESYGAQAVNEANKRTTQAHAAILARFAELERERDAYRALAGQAETALRNCGCDMNADLIRRAIAQRAGETG